MKIHEYNEMMRHLTRREPSDKHLATMPLYEQGGRVGYQGGKKVMGSQYVKAKPFNKKQQAAIKKQFPNADFSINRYGFTTQNPDGTVSKNYNNAVDFAKRGFVSHKIKRLPKNIQSEIQKTFGSSYKGDLNFKTHKFGIPVRGNELLYDRIRNFVDVIQESKRKRPNRGFLKFGFSELEGDNYLLNQFERNKNLLKDKSPYVRIFKDGKVIGFQDNTTKGKGNKYYHVNYKGKGLSIDSHPDFEKVNKYVKIAKNAKVDVGPTLNNLFFKSGYQIPTLNQLLQDLVRKKGVKTTANAIEKAHVKGVAYDTAELQLLTRDKNIKTKVILNDLEKNKISLKEADKLAKKDGIRIYTKGQYIGADVISPEKQVGDVKKFVERKVLQEVAETGSVDALAERIKLKKLGDKLDSKKVKTVLKDLNIPYNPGLSFMGAAGFDDLLKTIPATKVGKFIKGIGLEFEPLFEAGFYEYFRRKGYTHDQAREETFFYKLANPDRTGILEGADPLLERDLYQIKDEEGKITGERKTVKRYVDALKERDRINKILTEKQRGITTQRKDIQDRASEDVQDLARSGAYNRIKKILQPGSAESVAYNAAVEKQQMEQGVRGIEYGEYGQGDTERLAARREKERYRLMNKKFPSYTGPQIDQRLEDYGYYINPDNRYRSKGRSLYNPQGLKLIKGVGYDAISDYFKDQDKTAYFAENFREEKAAGGRIGFKVGGFDKGRRAFMKWLAGITGAAIAGGTGLIKLGKGAKTVAPQVTEEVIKRGADGMPTYIDNLINVVQSKGIKKLVDSNINKMPDTVHTYKGVEITQDAAGNTRIKKGKETFVSGSDEPGYREVEMEINRGGVGVKDEGLETQKTFQEPDEYFEGTLRPDMDGKMKDVDFHIDDADHLELKKIADEPLIKKAEGGLASYDTYLPRIDDVDY